jgi:hypothetical protein
MEEAYWWLKARFDNEKEAKNALPEVEKIMKHYVENYIEKNENELGDLYIDLFDNIIVVGLVDSYIAEDNWNKLSKMIQKLKGMNAIYVTNDENFSQLFIDMVKHFPSDDKSC